MKRILLSLGAILFTGAVVISSTGAFFSDVETSTGNTFTAGAIDLTVDSEQHYNNMVCTEVTAGIFQWQPEVGFTPGVGHYPATGTSCDGTWSATDLGAQKFFNFSDIKPGDDGENTISLHVSNNPAWACIDLVTTGNNENTAIEPEISAGDSATSTDGELAQNINFQTWLDDGAIDGWQNTPTTTVDTTEGDNIWQVGENALSGGTLASLLNATTTITLADGGFGVALTPSVTNYVGMFWCAGTITGGAGNLECDGASMGNLSQTDSAVANVIFRVEQERNNPNFRCAPRVAPVTTLTLEKVINQDQVDPVTEALWTLTADGVTVDLSGSEGQPGVTNVPVTAGAYVLSESVVSGFTQTDLQCTGAGASLVGNTVTITEGANVTCTFFNTENTLIID